MTDPRPTDHYPNPITDALRVAPTWQDLEPALSDREVDLINDHEQSALLDEAIALMRNKIHRLEEERAERHPTDLEAITKASTRPEIAQAARLTAQLILTQEVTAPEGRAILYALQLSLSALRPNDDKPRRQTHARHRRRKARNPRPAGTRENRHKTSKRSAMRAPRNHRRPGTS